MFEHILPPVNVWMAAILWGTAVVMFNQWLMQRKGVTADE